MKKFLLSIIAAVVIVCGAANGAVYAEGDEGKDDSGSSGIITCPGTTKKVNQISDCYNNNVDIAKEGTNNLNTILGTVINVIIGIVGFLAVVMMILGGINFITSQGDAAKVTKAKHTILYGVVGLIVALLAFAIVNFVLKGVFGNTSGGDDGTSKIEEVAPTEKTPASP